jgi:hypothetical protein
MPAQETARKLGFSVMLLSGCAAHDVGVHVQVPEQTLCAQRKSSIKRAAVQAASRHTLNNRFRAPACAVLEVVLH